MISLTDDTGVQLLWDAIDRVLALPEPPTVICFGNDRMAMRAYGILRSRGVSLPDELSVAGYDGHRLITDTLYPTLTSAELPYAAIGIRATELLLGMINGTADAPTQPILVGGPVNPGNSVKELPTPITQTFVNREDDTMKLGMTLSAALVASVSWASMGAAQTELSMWYHGAGNEAESAALNMIIDDFNASQSDTLLWSKASHRNPTTIPLWQPPLPATCQTFWTLTAL